MTSPQLVKSKRPLSPHLTIYRRQLTSVMSIFHRFTGIALTLGLPLLAFWFVAIAAGPDIYQQVNKLLTSIPGQILLFGWTWALFYHVCNGIRHLLWDTGRTLSLKATYITGYITIVISALLTAYIWCIAHRSLPWM